MSGGFKESISGIAIAISLCLIIFKNTLFQLSLESNIVVSNMSLHLVTLRVFLLFPARYISQ